MGNTDLLVNFLYKTTIGRIILKFIMITRADKLLVLLLRSSLSRFAIPVYAKKHWIEVCKDDLASYRSYRDFFARNKVGSTIDFNPGHLISPCDGWLSVYEISENSMFEIKGSMYSTADIVQDADIADKYTGGICILASNANIGGPTTAAGMAISQGWSKLVGPIMLVGTFGYVIGTYLGVMVGTILGA